MISQALGGIGLFLVGMVLVTDGLRAAAGDSLRRFLLRFTGGPVQGVLSGAAVTAVVQSSSATTVATIGFVGAGLLSFEQALGLIFGANLGTTATGWVVALFGLEFSVSAVALPLVGVGALIKLFSRGRAAHVGLALSGFGIIFVGIDVLQAGMESLSHRLTPSEFPRDTWLGRLALVSMGALLTTVVQSSSAAVTTTLAALHAGTVSLHQAAAMVIGINIGTTITAGIAAAGSSTAGKRTALAHLLFNGLTGAVAFATLPGFVWGIGRWGDRFAQGNAAMLLAAFHTAFNLLGVLLILPFSSRFAALVTRVIPHRGPHLTRLLDPKVATQGTMAAEAVRQTALEISRVVIQALLQLVMRHRLGAEQRELLDAAASALRSTEDYAGSLNFSTPLSASGHQRHLGTIHALDHLGSLVNLALGPPPAKGTPGSELRDLSQRLRDALEQTSAWSEDPKLSAPVDRLHHVHQDALATRRQVRSALFAAIASGSLNPAVAGAELDRLRWFEDVAQHAWRLCHHLEGERRAGPPADDLEEAE